MLSNPIGLLQQAGVLLVSSMTSVSIRSAECELATVLKAPNVFGSVSVSENTA